MKRILDKCLILIVFFFLLCSLSKALIFPKSINYYENRPANRPPALTAAGYLNSSFQNALEDALTDQVPFAQRMEQIYHIASSVPLEAGVHQIARSYPERYVSFLDMNLFGGDYITFQTVTLKDRQAALDQKIENYNQTFAAHPELNFCVYYVEKDTDINFESGALSGLSDYMLGGLQLPESQKAVFPVRSFAQFRTQFFRTDHHWNYQGSYNAYTQILQMLGKGEPLQPLDTQLIATDFCGSKARLAGTTSVFREDFYAYEFDFPAMQITVDGEPAEDYGQQNRVWDAAANGAISYSGYYGGDLGEIVFQTGNTGAGNLLVVGESYDNAILKLLASSFEHTYSIDLRYYETENGQPFRFSEYAATHDIDTVLLIGNIDYFTLEVFSLEDGV